VNCGLSVRCVSTSLATTVLNTRPFACTADIDKEISYMKLGVNTRARIIATAFLESFARGVVPGGSAASAPRMGTASLVAPRTD
jgi:hypothetical protein